MALHGVVSSSIKKKAERASNFEQSKSVVVLCMVVVGVVRRLCNPRETFVRVATNLHTHIQRLMERESSRSILCDLILRSNKETVAIKMCWTNATKDKNEEHYAFCGGETLERQSCRFLPFIIIIIALHCNSHKKTFSMRESTPNFYYYGGCLSWKLRVGSIYV